MIEVTFKMFSQLMRARKRSVDDLVDLFRGKIDDPGGFFERVMLCKWRGEDRSYVIIPYRSVIEFYRKEVEYAKNNQEEQERLALKRKRPISDERREALRKHMALINARKKSATVEN